MAGEVVLLDALASMFGMRARLALALKGINYEYKEQNLADKDPLLLKMNPIHKKVPVLIHNGKPICESLVIVQYIDDVWNDKSPLLPSDPYQRAQARFWADYVDKKIYDCGRKVWVAEGDDKEKANEEFFECLKLLEKELGEKPFFGGESLGYLDVALLPYYTWFHVYETYGNFSIESECPTLMAWVKRCLENETVSKSLPDPLKVYEIISVLISNGYGKQ